MGLFDLGPQFATATELPPHFVASFFGATIATEQHKQKLWQPHHEVSNQTPIFPCGCLTFAVASCGPKPNMLIVIMTPNLPKYQESSVLTRIATSFMFTMLRNKQNNYVCIRKPNKMP